MHVFGKSPLLALNVAGTSIDQMDDDEDDGGGDEHSSGTSDDLLALQQQVVLPCAYVPGSSMPEPHHDSPCVQVSLVTDKELRLSSQLDPFTLGITSLAALPSIDEPPSSPRESAAPNDKDELANEPSTPKRFAFDEDLANDDALKGEASSLSPSEADASDPTGGVVDSFDDEDYCGWLAEGI